MAKNINIVERLKKERELEGKVISEAEKVLEVEEIFNLSEKLDKKREDIKTLKSELSVKMGIVEKSLSPEVFQYLFGTSKKDVRSTSNGTIKKEIAKRILEGENLSEVAASLYPDRDIKDRNHLSYRHLQEMETDGLIKIVDKPVPKDNYSTVKIEKVKDF